MAKRLPVHVQPGGGGEPGAAGPASAHRPGWTGASDRGSHRIYRLLQGRHAIYPPSSGEREDGGGQGMLAV